MFGAWILIGLAAGEPSEDIVGTAGERAVTTASEVLGPSSAEPVVVSNTGQLPISGDSAAECEGLSEGRPERDLMDWAGLSLTFLSTVLWGFYVVITRKTFLEIKEQTTLQSRAFLVCVKSGAPRPKKGVRYLPQAWSLTDTWKTIVKQNHSESVAEDLCLSLVLHNRGKSDIVGWKLKVSVNVEPGSYIAQQARTQPQNEEFEIKNRDDNAHIEEGGKVVLDLIDVGSFPIWTVGWEAEYTDSRGGSYTTTGAFSQCSGQNPDVLVAPIPLQSGGGSV